MHPPTEVKLVDADFAILSALETGRNQAANIAADLGYSRKYINGRMGYLLDYDLVEKIGIKDSGLYQLTPKGYAANQLREEYNSDEYERDGFEALVEDLASQFEYIEPRFDRIDAEE